MSDPVKRQYDSSHRREQAAQTRERIIRSAHELFVTAGYGRTTIAQVARAAGVAVETVYSAFGSKRNLLRQVWHVDFRGDERDIPLYDRADMQAVLDEPDLPTRIRKHAEFVTHGFRRIAPLQHALQGAAASEPAAAAMLAEYSERRLDVAAKYARSASATGQLAVSEEECRDVIWAMLDGALWHDLVVERGWTDERFAAWLGQIWVAHLVGA
jgi:TetR/AcrR family transcriptional regulator, regulator of autoinduction and epiphytic fitness